MSSPAAPARSRTIVVTGSASGIGLATADLLRARNERVIGVDRDASDVVADLSTRAGRATAVREVEHLSRGEVDAVIACAGLSARTVAAAAVNYFGAVGVCEGLRPLLARTPAPRAVVVSSLASVMPVDDGLFAALTSGSEEAALRIAEAIVRTDDGSGPNTIYSSTKRALVHWVRQAAPSAEWAGHSIALNAVCPGTIRTPMTEPLVATAEGRAALADRAPAPFNGPLGAPAAVASLLAWLASHENGFVTGQAIFCDGGAEALARPALI